MNPLNNLLTYVLDFLCIKTKIFFLDFPSMINLWRLKEMNIWFHFIYAHISDDYFDSILSKHLFLTENMIEGPNPLPVFIRG